jgi:hypothetical protein
MGLRVIARPGLSGRSNLVFKEKIAAHPSGARNDGYNKQLHKKSLN